MRITTLQSSGTMMGYINNTSSKYYDLSEQAASGVRVSKLSDDPSAVKSILKMNTKLSELQGYLSNMSTAQSELDTVDSTLGDLSDVVQKASDYATQTANGTYKTSDLADVKAQIDQIMEGVVSSANTQFNGTYVFSGTATSTPAYTLNKDGSGNITSVVYNGTTSATESSRYVTISDGVSVAMNAKGNDVFGSYSAGPPATGSGLLYSLGTLSTALANNDTATISSTINSLDTNLDNITATRTKLAAVSNRFDMTTSSIKETVTNLKSYRSELQDADLAEVLTNLATTKSALQATYSVTSDLLSKTSLLNYM